MDEQPKPNLKRANEGSMSKNIKPDTVMDKVLAKIKEADSVLVALSNDPNVDEIAAAMGLSMALDSAGKHVTAIYSGKTPNVLEFLKPEERFETGTESLQDFVIALNKDKADHLRYKIDGDFVKVYVTPYKTTISGDDIEFSRGDYNVDLVISLNVPAATELDAALKEHGRIMHDATSINITNGAAGKFGDVEWVDPNASSISEMVAKLAFELEDKMDAATATALLTGLVAATDRFSNPATTPEAMVLAAKLMGAGADQQLVVQNVQGEVVFNERTAVVGAEAGEAKDATSLDINHGEEAPEEAPAEMPAEAEAEAVAAEAGGEEAKEQESEAPAEPAGTEEDSVKAAMASALNPAGAPQAPANNGTVAGVDVAVVPDNADGYAGQTVADQILNNMEKGESNVGAADYGKMIDEALNEPLPGEGGIQVGQDGPGGPQVDTQDVEKADVPEGNPVAGMPGADAQSALGAQMMAGAGQMGQGPMQQQPAEQGMTEEEALNLIKQGQAEANAALPGMPENGELPKIIPTGGGFGYESPVGANPAAEAAPSVGMEAAEPSPMGMEQNPMGMGANPMGMGSNPMPMPGQEIAPPPMAPMPDFGAMPPAMPAMPDMSAPAMPAVPVENTIPAPVATEPVGMPDVTVQPDMNAQIAEMGLPQVQEAPAAAPEAPVDPSAFKIPGIHT